MGKLIKIAPLVILGLLGGCAQLPIGKDTATRLDAAPLVFHDRAASVDLLTEQADTLKLMADDLRRKSTLRGATLGAVMGCGVGVVTSGGAQRCLVGAAAGGIVGAVAGNSAGQRDIDKRVDAATPEALMRSLRTTQDHVDRMQDTLPLVLSRQDAELARLGDQRAAGTLTAEAHEAGIEDIRQRRAHIAEALTLSAKQLSASRNNVQNAVDRGQTGLQWHLDATQSLEHDVYSARSGITLL